MHWIPVSDHYFLGSSPSAQVADLVLATESRRHEMESGQQSPELQRRFQAWKATTSALILESVNDQERVDRDIAVWAREFSQSVLDSIMPWVQSSDEGILENLTDIFREAITLDQIICRQSAHVAWVFSISNHPHAPLVFDPDLMAVERGSPSPKVGQRLAMVVAPGLKKRGKSTGEDFEVESLLLKVEVAI